MVLPVTCQMTVNPSVRGAATLLSSMKHRAVALAIAGTTVAGVLGFRSWLEARDDRMRLAATLASQSSIIAAAEKREQDRATELAATLKQIEELKRSVQTPQQVVRAIPQYLPPLPEPLETLPPTNGSAPAPNVPSGKAFGLPDTPARPGEVLSPDLRVPAADLKPLFDFVQDCRACQAKLTAALQDAQDERTKSAALARERDAAVKAAKGGSTWTRAMRAAKWLAVGFGVGYLTRAATR